MARLKQLSEEESSVKYEAPRAKEKPHSRRSTSLVFSTAPALKAAFLKQLSGYENRQPPEETEPATPKVLLRDDVSLSMPIVWGGRRRFISRWKERES